MYRRTSSLHSSHAYASLLTSFYLKMASRAEIYDDESDSQALRLLRRQERRPVNGRIRKMPGSANSTANIEQHSVRLRMLKSSGMSDSPADII